MTGKIYLVLLILCGIWSQAIIGAFTDENIRESSSFLVRQKRVISKVLGEDRPVLIEDHPYVVIIKKNNRMHCVGTILSPRIILTASRCVHYDRTSYKVVSGSTRSNVVRETHNVTQIEIYNSNHSRTIFSDGVALLTIFPPIIYSAESKKIDLHDEPVPSGEIGIVAGWGYNFRNTADRGTIYPLQLRNIEVPILAHQVCVNRYRGFYDITEKNICTFHPQKHTGHNDAGSPLVIHNKLVGIFIWRGPNLNENAAYPDVYAYLQHVYYKQWIMQRI